MLVNIFRASLGSSMDSRLQELAEMRHNAYEKRREAVAKAAEKVKNPKPELEEPERPPGRFVVGTDRPAELVSAPSKRPAPAVGSAPPKKRVVPSTCPDSSSPSKVPTKTVAVVAPKTPSVQSTGTVKPAADAESPRTSRGILTYEDVKTKYTDSQIVRVVRWYEAALATIPTFE